MTARVVWAALLLGGWGAAPRAAAQEVVPAPEPIRFQAPELLTFEEIKALSAAPYPTGALRDKLVALWETPVVSNEAYAEGARPIKPSIHGLGEFLRVVSWNIEHSLHVDGAIEAFTDADAFARQLDPRKAPPGSRRSQRALEERALLDDADVVILQEMEVGLKRSGYRDAARDLARALHMNYAYLAQYVEVDPVLLGTETIRFREGQEDAEATAYYRVDPSRYQGLFGSAVLSRYPIIKAEGFHLFHQGYNWYWQEKQKTTFLEKIRRFGAKTILHEEATREMKVGGRSFFRVDLSVPDLPEDLVSIINVHLEIKCPPEDRAAQMAEILHYIEDIRHPVILMGDFNAAPGDLSPTSTPRVISKTLSAPEFWLSRVLAYLLPQALLVNTTLSLSNMTKNYQNPTAPHVPLLAPNRVAELFTMIERFRFSDGGMFDFRGDRKHSAGGIGLLSNSNERDLWAYRTTFRVDRTVATIIGKYRLDWVFVKSYLKRSKDRRGPYRFAPHFGRTLNALNASLARRLSDHDPNVVDLPLQEPLNSTRW